LARPFSGNVSKPYHGCTFTGDWKPDRTRPRCQSRRRGEHAGSSRCLPIELQHILSAIVSLMGNVKLVRENITLCISVCHGGCRLLAARTYIWHTVVDINTADMSVRRQSSLAYERRPGGP